jgi:HD superfamily phosphohydrolase YqeK
LSVVLAREVFNVRDEGILSAIGCHTTLKANASPLDKVVFVADKLAWDQPGTPPYKTEMIAALEHSLDSAALVYLQYLWDRRDTLRVVHPWMVAAYMELSTQ